MHLYNLTLQRPTAIVNAVYGNFSSPKAQEIIVSRGKILELLRPDENGKVQTILSTEVFGVIRSIAPFRLTGGNRDYIIVGSDSGRIVILEYNAAKNRFDKIHQETYGKSGCRRIVPGQYLATDPKGRAVMIGATEKQKLVYILNRDSAARLTISSPLEAHKAHTILFSMIGVDVGFDNPIFACIEVDYEDEDLQKNLTYYELDLGLNHVVRKWTDAIDNKSNMLIAVPGGADGPGGVLIAAENYLYYKNQNHPELKVAIPRRQNSDPNLGIMIVTSATHRQKDKFFFLLQSEYGDLYKVTLDYQGYKVGGVHINYFDTVTVSNALAVMKTGFLFVGAEFGNHALYQFQGLNEEEERQSMMQTDEFSYFEPTPTRNLSLLDEVESLSPITEMKVADIAREETPQMYAICGRSMRSSVRVLRHGLAITEIGESELPGVPSAIWTVKGTIRDEFDKYIVVSFINATLVLSIGETVEEAVDSGFLSNCPTLHVANIGDDGLIQVHPGGIRHIRFMGDNRNIQEWKTPGKKTIVHATSNERQTVIALSGGDILYFEIDGLGNLSDVDKKFIGREVACLSIAPIMHGRRRTRFLAVGDWENTVRIFSLDPEDCLQSLSIQTLPTHPESLCIVHMNQVGDIPGNLYLNIGLNNGVLLRSIVDSITGDLTDTRTRYLGARPVKLLKSQVKGQTAVMALSSRSWLGYNNQGRYQLVPLSCHPLESASTFSSEQCPEGVLATSGNILRIITIDRLGDMFNQSSIPLLHTPRHFIVHPETNNLVIIETDHNASSDADRKTRSGVDSTGEASMEIEDENANAEGQSSTERNVLSELKPGPGKWASSIRLLDTTKSRTLDLLELSDNEAALCLCTCVFRERGSEVFLVVGTAKDMQLRPRECTEGFIHVYRIVEGRQFQLVHKTPVETFPSALSPFQGRLLVGVGNTLRIYDMGKKKLLRKSEYKGFPNAINNIYTQGDRIYVSDIQESIHFIKYKKAERQMYIFADTCTPRSITSMAVLDYDTVAGADKFGNIFVSRLPSQVSDEVEEDPTGSMLKIEQGYLNGAPHKLEDIAFFHVGDTVNSIVKTSLTPGGQEALLYTTIAGGVGVLIPFISREDVDFFTHLEMHLRQENPPLCGRDHLSYRSYYFPVKDVIDGDLCEQYSTLDAEKQANIAQELERTPMEVMKKLDDIRNRLL